MTWRTHLTLFNKLCWNGFRCRPTANSKQTHETKREKEKHLFSCSSNSSAFYFFFFSLLICFVLPSTTVGQVPERKICVRFNSVCRQRRGTCVQYEHKSLAQGIAANEDEWCKLDRRLPDTFCESTRWLEMHFEFLSFSTRPRVTLITNELHLWPIFGVEVNAALSVIWSFLFSVFCFRFLFKKKISVQSSIVFQARRQKFNFLPSLISREHERRLWVAVGWRYIEKKTWARKRARVSHLIFTRSKQNRCLHSTSIQPCCRWRIKIIAVSSIGSRTNWTIGSDSFSPIAIHEIYFYFYCWI